MDLIEKKVVLFGKTGSGKSTVANVLVTGGITEQVFHVSDALIGCTTEIQKVTRRGWTVTDTIGLGEAEHGSVPSSEAKARLTEFLKSVKDKYSHIIYVQKATKITTVDEIIWLLFTSIFEGAEEGFVVLFTGEDEKWLEENRKQFPTYLRDQNILIANIPPISRLPITERRQKVVREKSIRDLEDNLDKLFEKRGYQYCTPKIAGMSPVEIEQKSLSIIAMIAEAIKRMFNQVNWRANAAKFSTLVDLADFITNLVQLS